VQKRKKEAGPAETTSFLRFKIEPYPVDALKSHVRKLRKSDPAHVREIANSISALGFNVPLLVGKDNVVVDGDSRLEAAKLLGLSSVPCIRVDHLDETEQRLLRLAVNRLGEKGFWDLGELEAEFKELIIADVPIEISGFGSDEIDQVVVGGNGDGCEAGDLAPLPGASASARVNEKKKNRVARMVLTDEPFNVAIGGHVTGGDHREFVMASGEMTDSQFLDFNQKWMDAVLPHLVDGGILGTFIDWRGLPIAHTAATGLGLTPLNLVVWAKTNAGMGSLYRSQHALLPLFKKGAASNVNNNSLGRRRRHRTN
jgi:Predicted transcriptional regulators